jgi:glyoxylase-like metal-dependent hydrolase (beta-lactamase superfamily II)
MTAHFAVMAAGGIQCNSVVLWDDETNHAIIIDPTDDARPSLAFVEKKQLKVQEILITHGHFDHCADTETAMKATGKTAKLHPRDHYLYHQGPEHARIFGCHVSSSCQTPLESLAEGDVFSLSPNITLQTLYVPGHSPGSVAFFVPQGPWLFSGDVLFAGSIGRTDLPGGNFNELRDSIQNKLYQLPHDCVVVPGHGPKTTIGHEKKSNTFVRGD